MFTKKIVILLMVFVALWLTSCTLTYEMEQKREGYLERAQNYYRYQKYYNALQQIELALEIDSDCKRAYIAKGWTLFFLRKYEDAEQAFENALELDSTDPWIHYGMGSIFFKRGGQIERKMKKLQKRIAEESDLQKQKRKRTQFAGDIQRYGKEYKRLYDLSLQHFQTALDVNPENYQLFKMMAMVYIVKGRQYYSQAISHLDSFIKILESNAAIWKQSLQRNEKERKKVSLKQKEREQLDNIIDTLRQNLKKNRREYCIAQGMAGDLLFQQAQFQLEKEKQATSSQEKAKCRRQMLNYCRLAKKRVNAILQVDPNKANQYRNLAQLAKLEGNYQLAAQYLKVYVKQYPMHNARMRAQAKLQIELLEEQTNIEKR